MQQFDKGLPFKFTNHAIGTPDLGNKFTEVPVRAQP